jgi:hypothetical protein
MKVTDIGPRAKALTVATLPRAVNVQNIEGARAGRRCRPHDAAEGARRSGRSWARREMQSDQNATVAIAEHTVVLFA